MVSTVQRGADEKGERMTGKGHQTSIVENEKRNASYDLHEFFHLCNNGRAHKQEKYGSAFLAYVPLGFRKKP